MKYKIKKSEGCTAYYTEINGKLIQHFSEHELYEFTEYLLHKIGEGIDDNTIALESLFNLFQYDDYKYDGKPCDQCGDSVWVTIWNI